MTLRDRALAAGREFAERAYYSPSSLAARLAFASDWLAGYAAGRRKCS